MKYALPGLVLATSLLLPAALRAGETKRRIPLIGVVRIQQVFKDYAYAREQENKIKEEFKGQEEEIKTLKGKIEKKQQALAGNALMRRGSLAWKLEMLEIQRMRLLIEDKMNAFKKATRERMAGYYVNVYAHFRKAVDDYAKHYKYDIVITAPDRDLSKETEESGAPEAVQNEILLRRVQYISVSVDITKPIVELMNARYKKSKSAPTDL